MQERLKNAGNSATSRSSKDEDPRLRGRIRERARNGPLVIDTVVVLAEGGGFEPPIGV